MNKALQAELAALGKEVWTATAPGECKHTATWCAGQLPALYEKLCQTNESRYGAEITRLVRGMLQGLVQSNEELPEIQKLEARLINRFRLLHERLGLPPLNLKPYRASPPRP